MHIEHVHWASEEQRLPELIGVPCDNDSLETRLKDDSH